MIRLVALLACVAFAASCEKSTAKADGTGGSAAPKPVDSGTFTRDQAVFDAQRRPDKIVEALGLKPGSRVADVGAGSGLLTVHLARAVAPNGKVVATDIDQDVLDNFLKPRLVAAGLAELVEPRRVDGELPGLEANAFDAILLAEVDHYLTDPAKWLEDAAKALKPGGRLVISNRIHRRDLTLAAAKKAKLVLVGESTPVPTHFIAIYEVK